MKTSSRPVREAIGLLFEYRRFLYEAEARPKLVALFTEPVGDDYAELLDKLEISAVWRGRHQWIGSSSALHDRLAERVRQHSI